MESKKTKDFWHRRGKIDDPDLATQFKKDDSLHHDLVLIKKFVTGYPELLELGCGTCRIANELEPLVSSLTVVDREPSLMRFCKKSNKITKVVADIITYENSNAYDLILLFGVMNYLSFEEAKKVYTNAFKMLKESGYLLVRHACGVIEDVIVDKYSEEIGDWYYAEYRHFLKERLLLESIGFTVTLTDVYPEHLNPWTNTHFYAFIAKK